MKKILYFILLLLVGCASVRTSYIKSLNLTSKEKVYVQKIKSQPLQFFISNDISEIAWSRANSFIARYSSTKIRTANKYVIQTDTTYGYDIQFGYSVSRTIGKDSTNFHVSCFTNVYYVEDDALNNAKILSYYIKTGNLPYPHLISQ